MISVAEVQHHVEFNAFVAYWQRDRRCPIALADWLRERDYDSQSLAALAAATSPDLPPSSCYTDYTDYIYYSKFSSGPSPSRSVQQNCWQWYLTSRTIFRRDIDDIEFDREQKYVDGKFVRSPTFLGAILFYLDYRGEHLRRLQCEPATR
jgi:hypothetical protein